MYFYGIVNFRFKKTFLLLFLLKRIVKYFFLHFYPNTSALVINLEQRILLLNYYFIHILVDNRVIIDKYDI